MNEKLKEILEKILVVFIIAFITHLSITWLWSYFLKEGVVSPDWKRSIVFAIILCIIIPFIQKKSSSTPQ
jgi:hypothetical protein